MPKGSCRGLDSLAADITAVEQRIALIEQQQERCQQQEQANQQLQSAFADMKVAGLAAKAEVELKQQALDDIGLQQENPVSAVGCSAAATQYSIAVIGRTA